MKLLGLAVLPLAATAPLQKRQAALSSMDIDVLQLAHYLENLEYSLYTGGFSNFTEAQYEAAGFPPGFRDNVGVTAQVWIDRLFFWREQSICASCRAFELTLLFTMTARSNAP